MILVNSAIDGDHRSNLVFKCCLLPFYGRNLVNLRFCQSYWALARFTDLNQFNIKLF
jgi:hypothetical protein